MILQKVLLSKTKAQPSGLTSGTWTKVQVHVYNRQNPFIKKASTQISLYTLYMCFQHTSTTSKMSSLHPVVSQFESWTNLDLILMPKSVIVSQVYNMNCAQPQLYCINSSFPFTSLTGNTQGVFQRNSCIAIRTITLYLAHCKTNETVLISTCQFYWWVI